MQGAQRGPRWMVFHRQSETMLSLACQWDRVSRLNGYSAILPQVTTM